MGNLVHATLPSLIGIQGRNWSNIENNNFIKTFQLTSYTKGKIKKNSFLGNLSKQRIEDFFPLKGPPPLPPSNFVSYIKSQTVKIQPPIYVCLR